MEYQSGAVRPIGSIEQGWQLIKNDYFMYVAMVVVFGIILIVVSLILSTINSVITNVISAALGVASADGVYVLLELESPSKISELPSRQAKVLLGCQEIGVLRG